MVFPPGTLSCSFVMATCGFVSSARSHIFFSCFCFCFCFFFFIVYIQVLTARLSEQILVFVLLENNNNNKTTKKKIVATRILGEKKS